jgi:hypothetical protein
MTNGRVRKEILEKGRKEIKTHTGWKHGKTGFRELF